MLCYSKIRKVITLKERIIRMGNFSAKSIAPRLFNRTKFETKIARESNQAAGANMVNPFKNSGIKMDVLTADVFGTASKTDTSGSIISKTKRMYSTFVGSMNGLGSSFRHGIESIGAFCSRIRNSFSNTWTFLHETKVPSFYDAGHAIKSKWDAVKYNKDVQKYAAMPVADLKNTLVNELSFNAAA